MTKQKRPIDELVGRFPPFVQHGFWLSCYVRLLAPKVETKLALLTDDRYEVAKKDKSNHYTDMNRWGHLCLTHMPNAHGTRAYGLLVRYLDFP